MPKRSGFLMALLLSASTPATAQISGANDRWWDVISTNGQTIFLDTDKVWAQNGRTLAVVRMAPIVNGVADRTKAPDLVAATDCRNQLHVFGLNEDYLNAPMGPTGGLGLALMGAICRQGRTSPGR